MKKGSAKSKKPLARPASAGRVRKEQKQTEPEDYILLRGQIYHADTFTQRNQVKHFVDSVKQSTRQAKSFSNKVKSTDIDELVRSMSQHEKKLMLDRLERQMKLAEDSTASTLQNSHVLEKLLMRMDGLAMEIQLKWESLSEDINSAFRIGNIHETERKRKLQLIGRIKEHKLGVIQYTAALFRKLLSNEYEDTADNRDLQIESILKSLNSFSEFAEDNKPQAFEVYQQAKPKGTQITHHQEQYQATSPSPTRQILTIKTETDDGCQMGSLQNYSPSPGKLSEVRSSNQIPNNDDDVFGLRLDIRLQEVNFDRDYESELVQQANKQTFSQKQSHSEKPQLKLYPVQTINQPNPQNSQAKLQAKVTRETQEAVNSIQINFSKKEVPASEMQINFIERVNVTSQIMEAQEVARRNNLDRLKIMIPHKEEEETHYILMQSDEDIQRLEFQMFQRALDMRIGVQRGLIELKEQPPSLSTLYQINEYLLEICQFVNKHCLHEVIENFQVNYGLTAADKLRNLRLNNGRTVICPSSQILSQSKFIELHREIVLNSCPVSESMRAHNLALFQAFNNYLEIYRSLYEHNGEKYPWIDSSKGLTFYQINYDNIDEVMNRVRLKILEDAALLDGILLPVAHTNPASKNMRNVFLEDAQKKGDASFHENYAKCEELEMMDIYAWVRILISDAIEKQEIKSVASWLTNRNPK